MRKTILTSFLQCIFLYEATNNMCTVHKYILYNALFPNPSDNDTLCSRLTVSTLLYKPFHVQFFLLYLQRDQC